MGNGVNGRFTWDAGSRVGELAVEGTRVESLVGTRVFASGVLGVGSAVGATDVDILVGVADAHAAQNQAPSVSASSKIVRNIVTSSASETLSVYLRFRAYVKNLPSAHNRAKILTR